MTPASIRETRTGLGLTQGTAARLVGVDGRTWRRWELGEREMPEPVCRLLGLLQFPHVVTWLDERRGRSLECSPRSRG